MRTVIHPADRAGTVRIVYLYANAGGGHKSTAQALQISMDRRYGSSAVGELVNAAPYMPWPFGNCEKIYAQAVRTVRPAYHAVWRASDNRPIVTAARWHMEHGGYSGATRLMADHPADIYVSCLSLTNQFLAGPVKQRSQTTKFLSVVTDPISVHAGFWSPWVDAYAVPTESARNAAIASQVKPSEVFVTGQPVHPDFFNRVMVGKETRAKLGLHPDLPIALLMGGGDGMGPLLKLGLTLGQMDQRFQIVVICGRNERIRRSLAAAHAKNPIISLGFSECIPELMGCADVLITKAGPGTIAEAVIARRCTESVDG